MAIVEREARRQGVEDFRSLIARSSQTQAALRPAGPAPIQRGEALLVSVAASYQRHWAELGGTFCLGKVPEELVKNHSLARDIFGKLTAGIRAGASARAAGEWLKEIPSPAARDSLQQYGLGNGIGLDLAEKPFLERGGAGKIQPGMALTLRVCLFGSGAGSALIAQPFVVNADGVESLVKPVENLVSVEA